MKILLPILLILWALHPLSAQTEGDAVSLSLTARAGLEKLTPREASVYYLRLDSQVEGAQARIAQLQQEQRGYQDFLDAVETKSVKYPLSPINQADRDQIARIVKDMNTEMHELTTAIEGWKRRQAFLLENYPIGGEVITLRDKFRLAPETKSDQFLNLDIPD